MAEIVVGYDGSGCSAVALERAAELARDLGDRLVLVFGYSPPGAWGGEIAEHEQAVEEFGRRVLGEARARAGELGVEASMRLVPKRAAEALVGVAAERGARMIVVGSYGEKPLKRMILGSTPNKLLYTAERPVLVVPA